VPAISELRDLGEQTVEDAARSVRATLQRRIRHMLGVRGDPPRVCEDPEDAYLPVDGATRLVHGDLPSMLVGGVASLLMQMLHPLTMTGVAQHSRYREDPLGRLARTARFVGTTTFGSIDDASAAIARVRSVHEFVRGVSDDGVAYQADDPHLLEWVHLSELTMFLAAARTYGPYQIDDATADQYVSEMSQVATDLGVIDPPHSLAEASQRIGDFRHELLLIDSGREARDFVLRGVSRAPQQRLAYATIVAAAIGLLEPWARDLLELPYVDLGQSFVVRPAATALCMTMRLAVPPVPSRRDR
jgi:uncharacterized protein (DUF2236 family)